MNLLGDSAALLANIHADLAAQQVCYRRPGTDEAPGWQVGPIPASVGRQNQNVARLTGLRIGFDDRDYLIRACDLPTTPADGDEITDAGQVYVVRPASSGEQAWRYSDPFNVRYRIHAQRQE